ncbi:MAG: hypothetical protein PHY47_00855 [Lachnospiraceae bacterium]|nr:hypothetical protein [Lachnospiraceae bacterium]
MGLFDLVLSNGPQKQLKLLNKKVKDISHDSRILAESLVTIDSTNKTLDIVFEKFRNADFSKQKASIDSLKLTDEYKNELKASIDACKTKALETLEPLIEQGQKLQGNMIAAELKGRTMLVVLESQRKVIESGAMQLKVIKEIEAEGAKNSERIKQLVADTEAINQTTRNAITQFNHESSIDQLLGTAIEANPKNDFTSVLADFEKVAT